MTDHLCLDCGETFGGGHASLDAANHRALEKHTTAANKLGIEVADLGDRGYQATIPNEVQAEGPSVRAAVKAVLDKRNRRMEVEA